MMMQPNNQAQNLRTNPSAPAGQAPNLFGQTPNAPQNNYNTNGNQLTGYHNQTTALNGQLNFAPNPTNLNGPMQAGPHQPQTQATPYGNNLLNTLSASLTQTVNPTSSLSQANSPRRRESFDRRQDAANMFGTANNTGLFSSNGIDYGRHLNSQTKNSYYGILPSQTPPPNQAPSQFNSNSNPLSNVIGLNPTVNGNQANGSNRVISAAPGK